MAWSFQITFLPMPIDPSCGVEWGAAHACEVFERESELGQNLLMRNALATVEGGARGGNLTGFFLRNQLIVHGSIGVTAGQGIGHHFEQMNDGGNLARSQPLDQITGPEPVVFRSRGPSEIVYQQV